LLRAGADEADGALGILQRGWMAVTGAKPVVQDEGGDAAVVEPLRDLLALVIEGEAAVAAAGDDDDGGGSAFALGRQIEVEAGPVLVSLAEGAGGAVWPQQHGALPLGACRAGAEQDGIALDVGQQVRRLLRSLADLFLDEVADLGPDVLGEPVPGDFALLVLRLARKRLDDEMEEDAVPQVVRLEGA